MKSTVLCMIFMFSLTYSQPQFNFGGPVHDIPSRDQAQPIPSVDNENVQPRPNITRHGHMCVPGQWCGESQHCCPATTGRYRCCPQLTECSADGLSCNPLNGTQAFENLEEKFHQIELDSGILNLGNRQYNNVSFDELEYHGILGEGACGVVTKRSYKGFTFAVKEMKRSECVEEMKRILMDLHVIRQSNASPHIVRSLGYILTSQDLYICMELMTSCLERILKQVGQGLPEAIIGKVTVSVLNGLNYLIESIMHRDVKPSNMLMDLQGNIKLCDFGIAGRLLEHLPPSVTLGCISYLAPERIERKPYDIRADVWSLGISLIYLAKSQFPYEQDTQFGMMLRILNNPAPTINPQDSKFSLEFCKFVERCLQKDMEKRATYSVLFTLPFYVKSDEEKVDVAEWCQKYMNK